jgi:carbonic anhydrase
VTQAKTYAHGDDLVESAIKENIHQSARDVLANSAILSEAVKSGKIKVIEAEYQLDTGEVVLLNSSARGRN